MVAIRTPITKGTVYTPVMKTCRVATTRGMMRTQKPWTRINDLSSLHPEGQFRAVALDAARRFVSDMERQGLTLITAEADMRVYGPIRHRDFSAPGVGAPTWRPAPGADPTFRAVGWGFEEDWTEDAEDFLLRAEFLASRVHLVEYLQKEDVPA